MHDPSDAREMLCDLDPVPKIEAAFRDIFLDLDLVGSTSFDDTLVRKWRELDRVRLRDYR